MTPRDVSRQLGSAFEHRIDKGEKSFETSCYFAILRLCYVSLSAGALLMFVAATAAAHAQETPAPAPEVSAPAPAVTERPTLMDMQYDGQTHITVAPYVWLPTVKGNFQFSVPTLPRRPGHTLQGSVQVGPSDYLAKLNSAAMMALDVRKGGFDIFGDYIYTNATATASFDSVISGPRGRVHVPVSFATSARLAARIWEAAGGFTVARGHDADLSIFLGIREFPVNLTLGYNATIGKRGIIARSGTITASEQTNDVITGLRGKAFFGDGRLFVPYYIDIGTGASNGNQTWEGLTGAGYAFSHGQTLIFTYRTLNYFSFPPVDHVQKLTMSGPLIGYTFNL